MSTGPITFTFPDVTDDVANVYAEDLKEALEDTLTGSDRIERQRSRSDSQDFGATLVLVLGTTAVTAIAEGIRTWLARNSGAAIDVTVGGSKKVTLHGRNLDSQAVQALASAIASARKE
jgi:membrane-associated two-gene conflict system component 1 (EACC1)